MAQIPVGTKFIGLSPNYQTKERRSTLINSESEPYTMQDFIDTIQNKTWLNDKIKPYELYLKLIYE